MHSDEQLIKKIKRRSDREAAAAGVSVQFLLAGAAGSAGYLRYRRCDIM